MSAGLSVADLEQKMSDGPRPQTAGAKSRRRQRCHQSKTCRLGQIRMTLVSLQGVASCFNPKFVSHSAKQPGALELLAV